MTRQMRTLLLLLLWLLPSGALANDELITLQSAHSVPVTVQRLKEAITANGYTILATIDQAAHAADYGVKIPARTLIAFAWMEGWTGHLIETPTVAIELPNRVLVWEDKDGVWVTRNTARYFLRNILGRHEARGMEGRVRIHDAKVGAMIDTVTR